MILLPILQAQFIFGATETTFYDEKKTYYTLSESGPNDLSNRFGNHLMQGEMKYLVSLTDNAALLNLLHSFVFVWHSKHPGYPISTLRCDSIWPQWIPNSIIIWELRQRGLQCGADCDLLKGQWTQLKLKLNTGTRGGKKDTRSSWLTRLLLWSNCRLVL